MPSGDLEIVMCTRCGQKLALYPYMIAGSRIVCANPNCNATLKIVSRYPAKVEEVPFEETLNADAQPESYG